MNPSLWSLLLDQRHGQSKSSLRGSEMGGKGGSRNRDWVRRCNRVQDERHHFSVLILAHDHCCIWLEKTLKPQLGHPAHSEHLHLSLKPSSSLAPQEHLQVDQGQGNVSQGSPGLGFSAPKLITVIIGCLTQ